MALFGSRDSRLLPELVDSLYRITTDELQELLKREFRVRITAARHEFREVPDKLGADGVVSLVSDRMLNPLPPLRTKAETASFHAGRETSSIVISSSRHDAQFDFCSESESDQRRWRREISENLESYGIALLYWANRYRASQALQRGYEEERDVLSNFSVALRGKRPHKALRTIAHSVAADWVVVSLSNSIAENVLPVFASDPRLLKQLEPEKKEDLTFFTELAERPSGEPLSVLIPSDASCNCRTLRELGARRVTSVAFGPRIGGTPRGTVSFYHKAEAAIEQSSLSLVRQIGREIAGWIDEVDDNAEHEVTQAAIRLAGSIFASASSGTTGREAFPTFLFELGKSLEENLPFREAPGGKGAVRVSLVPESRVAQILEESGYVGDDSQHFLRNRELFFLVRDEDASLFSSGTDGSDLLVISASPARVGILRPKVAELLRLLVTVVRQLDRIDRRRTEWMQRTIHEIRHPLQGMVTIASEVQRMAQTVSVPRREIGFFASDMDICILRLTVLLEIFKNLAGLEDHTVANQPTLIERDVLRPMRRLLGQHAQKRRVSIGATQQYGVIPEIRTDPNLLSVIFYNLIDNAIKYSKEGTTIEIVCDEDSLSFQISVRNIGLRINPNESERIFDEGIRGEEAERSEVGLGLGLYIARRVSALLGCEVTLDETRDDTVSFTLWIPRSAAS